MSDGGDGPGAWYAVLLVGHQGMLVESLGRMLRDEDNIEVVDTVGSPEEAVRLAGLLEPSVVIVDASLPDGDAVTTAATIREVSPSTRILLLVAVTDSRLVASAIEAGCSGIITKEQGFRELVSAVHLAHVGDVYLAPEILAGLLPRIDRSYRGLGYDLTERET